MSFRRFVFLVTKEFNNRRPTYMLRRFDVGRLFLQKFDRDRLCPPAVEEGQLPDPEIRFDTSPASLSHIGIRHTRFLLFGGTSHGRCRVDDVKVLSVDPMGHALLYDTGHKTIRALRSLPTPQFAPFSLTDGKKNLYIMDSWFIESLKREDCFQALVYDHYKYEDWTPSSLPAPPYASWFQSDFYRYSAHVMSYTVVGGSSLWFSKELLGTHCFDTNSSEWTKVGDWALPFYGRVEYVPEQGLYFGLTTRFDEKDSVMGAADLAVAPWTARILWKDDLQPPNRDSISANLVYLGQSRFCHARFFDTWTPGVVNSGSNLVVLTALEVERRGNELAVVKHRSVQYNFKYHGTTSVL